MTKEKRTTFLLCAKIAVLALGCLLLLAGLVGGTLYFLLSLRHAGYALAINSYIAAFVALTLPLGAMLAYQAIRSLLGHPSGEFHLPPPWLALIPFVVGIVGGRVSLSSSSASLSFPLFHILAAASPAVAVLALVARRLRTGAESSGARSPSWREMVLEIAHGALLAPPLVAILEILFFAILALAIGLGIGLTPQGASWLRELAKNLATPGWVEEPANLWGILRSPPILLMVMMGVVVVAPLIEELLKASGVLLLSYRRPTRAQAFAWGIACGAGFAVAENLFNGIALPSDWGATMLVRAGATLVHCLGGGLMGMGWHYAFAARQIHRWVGSYLASVGFHSLWNLLALGVMGTTLLSTTISGLVMALLIALLALVALSAGLIIHYLAGKVSAP